MLMDYDTSTRLDADGISVPFGGDKPTLPRPQRPFSGAYLTTLDDLFALGDVRCSRIAYGWVELNVWVEDAHGTVSAIGENLGDAIDRVIDRIDIVLDEDGYNPDGFDPWEYARQRYAFDEEEYQEYCDERYRLYSEELASDKAELDRMADAERDRQAQELLDEQVKDALDAIGRDPDPEPTIDLLTDDDIARLIDDAGAGFPLPTPSQVNPSIAAASEPFTVVQKSDGTKTALYAIVIAVPTA